MEEQSNSSSLIPQIGRDLSINCLIRCSRSDYGYIASVNRSFRSLVRTGELHRARRNRGIVEHWVYFSFNPFGIGWMCFDPVGIRWMHVPRLPLSEPMLSDKEALAVGTELLVFGMEMTGLHQIFKFSILTKSWSLGREMNEPRCLFGSASLGKIAIVAGGCDSKGNMSSSAEIYNSDTDTWVSLPRMNRPRRNCSGVFIDGNFYVVGGMEVGNTNVTSGEMYDLKTRRWHEIPNMFPARINETEAPPLLAAVKNELYAAFYKENEVRKYDKGRNLWSTIGRLPEGLFSVYGSGLTFMAYGDRLIVSGGPSLGRGIEVYDCVPDEGPLQWSLLTFNDMGGFVYHCAVMGC